MSDSFFGELKENPSQPRMSGMLQILCAAFLLAAVASASAEQVVSRAEALEIARTYAEFRWRGGEENARAGKDSAGILIRTPSAPNAENAGPGYWIIGQENQGVPYKWGGFDSLTSFSAGVRGGKAAGDLYTTEKRRLADSAVSAEAVGLDCSGFISRCWKLRKKYGTSTLPGLCVPLRSTSDLKPGDIMNAAGGHVVLFAGWLDAGKDRARFYEANPYSKVQACEFSVRDLAAGGFKPWRLRGIRE